MKLFIFAGLFLILKASDPASIVDFNFVAEQQFSVKEFGFLTTQNVVEAFQIPDYSTVSIGPNKIEWNMCGSQSYDY